MSSSRTSSQTSTTNSTNSTDSGLPSYHLTDPNPPPPYDNTANFSATDRSDHSDLSDSSDRSESPIGPALPPSYNDIATLEAQQAALSITMPEAARLAAYHRYNVSSWSESRLVVRSSTPISSSMASIRNEEGVPAQNVMSTRRFKAAVAVQVILVCVGTLLFVYLVWFLVREEMSDASK